MTPSAPVFHAVLADARTRSVRFEDSAHARLSPRQFRAFVPGPLPADVLEWIQTAVAERLAWPDADRERPFKTASGASTTLLLDLQVMLAAAAATARERLGLADVATEVC